MPKAKRRTTRTTRPKAKRKFATSWHKYESEIAARKRRRDVREHGSVRAARKARRLKYEADRREQVTDKAEWRTAFAARHGRAPTDMDWLTDYNYSWRDRYARYGAAHRGESTARGRYTATDDRVIDRIRKLCRLARSPNAHEAALARERARDLMRQHGISEIDVEDCR